MHQLRSYVLSCNRWIIEVIRIAELWSTLQEAGSMGCSELLVFVIKTGQGFEHFVWHNGVFLLFVGCSCFAPSFVEFTCADMETNLGAMKSRGLQFPIGWFSCIFSLSPFPFSIIITCLLVPVSAKMCHRFKFSFVLHRINICVHLARTRTGRYVIVMHFGNGDRNVLKTKSLIIFIGCCLCSVLALHTLQLCYLLAAVFTFLMWHDW